MISYAKPETYLPHRAPMCVLTHVVMVDDTTVTCETQTTPDGVLKTHWRPDGELPEAFVLEIMAQTVGVWARYHGDLTPVPEGDAEAEIGLLLSVRSIEIDRVVRQGEPTLVCTMHKLMLDGQLAVFEGEVMSGNERVASGRLTVYQPLESEVAALFGEN